MLTDNQWQLADQIAQTLVKEETDINEFSKAVAYLRSLVNKPNAGSRFFEYLRTLVKYGHQVSHSKRTQGYYESINQTCNQYLKTEKDSPEVMLMILGWAVRLMRYYKDAVPIGELTALAEKSSPGSGGTPEGDQGEISERQVAIAEVVESQTFEIGQVLDAKVVKISGNKVTYEMLGTIRLTNKEPKRATSLNEEQLVQVKITALKDDGGIKSIKLCD